MNSKSNNSVKTVEIDEAIISLRADNIVNVHFKEGIDIDIELQSRLYGIYQDICGDNKLPFLFTANEFCSVTEEAKEYAIEMESEYPGLGTAIVAHNLAYQIIANFYLKVKKPKTPFKVFRKEETAVKWLKSL